MNYNSKSTIKTNNKKNVPDGKKALIIAEKPSVGRDIARVLGCTKKNQSYIEGDKYIVTWALGHLVTLADPEAYDKRYSAWNLEDLPIIPGKMKLVVMKGSGKQFGSIQRLLERNDVSEVIIATDAGREGELVARWILYKAHSKKPIKRLWISSVTDKAIREGFKNLKDGRAYNNLYKAAEARAEADWIVGINASRALTTKYNAQLSCGRVQTPSLAMVAARDAEIKAFQPKDYYGLTAHVGSMKLTWQDLKGQTRSFSEDKIKDILSKVKGKSLVVSEIKKSKKKQFAPHLYDLTTLQQEAHHRYGYSAKKTLSIIQSLYETHKVLTYPRTDSKHLTSDMRGTLKERIEACGVGDLRPLAFKLLKGNIQVGKSVIDDNKVSDHHAIVPTEVSPFLNSLETDERRIYEMVTRRFLAVFHPAYEYEQTVVTASCDGHLFTMRGKTLVNEGWKVVYKGESLEDLDHDNQTLPTLKVGQSLDVRTFNTNKGKTAPPARFNEGTLLKAMENPAKYLEHKDQAFKKILGETGGIGTVATRADIIEKLFKSFLIESDGKDIKTTSKGKQLLELVPEALKSPDLTAEWEMRLNAIASGKEQKGDFVHEMRTFTKTAVKEISSSAKSYKHDNMTREKCPDCGKFMLRVKGKRGEMLVCQDRDCGYRKSISKVTNARCPNCHKKMKMVGEGEGKKFVCKCGYKEKLSSFNKRKKEEGKKGNVRDVKKYMQSQKSDEPFNTAMADMLKGLFDDKE